ncbi:MAG: glycosyltransferase family 4 protein [Acidimicrobiia bacterium]
MSALHQFLPSFAAGDAIGHHVRRVQRVLREAGYESEIFADEIQPSVRRLARPYQEFTPPANGEPTRLLYHLSTGSPMAGYVAGTGQPLAVYYHNITPARFFERWEPEATGRVRGARSQLRQLAGPSRFAMANSAYSAGELTEAGYANVSVVPVLVDFDEYDVPPDPAALDRLRRAADAGGATWLFVGRLAPNKCQHDVIGAFALYRELFDPKARLHLIGGRTSMLYWEGLRLLAEELGCAGAVELTDVLTFPEVLAHYRTADVFVSLSEHEGFCVPLLEAMHFGVPVVALGASAVAETVADAGLVLPDNDPVTVACAAHRVLTDDGLRAQLVGAGHRRVEHFSFENNRKRLLSAVEEGLAHD